VLIYVLPKVRAEHTPVDADGEAGAQAGAIPLIGLHGAGTEPVQGYLAGVIVRKGTDPGNPWIWMPQDVEPRSLVIISFRWEARQLLRRYNRVALVAHGFPW
jgi:hypothetical protein